MRRLRLTDIYSIAAFPLLVLAQGLIRALPLRVWRASLGPMHTLRLGGQPGTNGLPAHLRDARCARIAAAVDRADTHLPLPTKCLARAVVTQWLARARGCRPVLVIAAHAGPLPPDTDRFHAWVETGSGIVIGHCDTAAYRPMLRFGAFDRA